MASKRSLPLAYNQTVLQARTIQLAKMENLLNSIIGATLLS